MHPIMKYMVVAALACSIFVTTASGHRASRRQDRLYVAAAVAELVCDCQCSSYTWTDKRGSVQGNCKSTYRGKQWCYVDTRNKNCEDLQWGTSVRKQWSYQACSTPALHSAECRGQPTTSRPSPGWSSWSACSKTCGGGTQTRTRRGYRPQSTSCNTYSCPYAPPVDNFCFCLNPFAGTGQAYIGEPETTCRENGWCYVDRNADCRDRRAAAGQGRWYSNLACGVRDGNIAYSARN